MPPTWLPCSKFCPVASAPRPLGRAALAAAAGPGRRAAHRGAQGAEHGPHGSTRRYRYSCRRAEIHRHHEKICIAYTCSWCKYGCVYACIHVYVHVSRLHFGSGWKLCVIMYPVAGGLCFQRWTRMHGRSLFIRKSPLSAHLFGKLIGSGGGGYNKRLHDEDA